MILCCGSRWAIGGKIAAGICYTVGRDALTVRFGGHVRKIAWEDISEIGQDRFRMFDVFPVWIRVNGEKEKISQNVEGIYELVWEIAQHLPENAECFPGFGIFWL